MQSIFKSDLPKFTVFITALCAILYFFTSTIDLDQQVLMALFHFPAEDFQQQEYWRYFSHSLIHLSLGHIAFNLTWWWLFGGAIEKKFGSITLIALFVLSAFATGVSQNWASGPWFFGLSGVVYAVMGFVFCVDKFSPTVKFDLPDGFFTMLAVGIAFGFISPLIGIEMGNTAHISGLVIGLIWGFLQAKLGK
ncbi:rhomboid family intramembrane serine protease [Pasteurellaceae bacterium Pebbles2]|nr:rhomboid family intramembrane serine protease [Pasteurellaceae bacterium Pebbles2]